MSHHSKTYGRVFDSKISPIKQTLCIPTCQNPTIMKTSQISRAFIILLPFVALLFIQSCSKPQTETNFTTYIAYTSGDHVYVNTWPEGNARQVAPGKESSLSHDGRYLAYSILVGEKRRVGITDLILGRHWFIEDIHGAGFRPQWSPTENHLLFTALGVTDNIPHRVILIYDPFSKTKSAIIIDKSNIFSPVWAPDGQTILAHDTETLFEWSLDGKLIERQQLQEKFGDFLYHGNSTFRPCCDRRLWVFNALEEITDDEAVQPIQSAAIYIHDTSLNTTRRITPPGVFANGYCWGPGSETLIVAVTVEETSPERLPPGNFLLQYSTDGKLLGISHDNALEPSLLTIAQNTSK
jgi:TolB protein